MTIIADRVSLSDADADLLAQASRLMGEALDRSKAHRIALVEQRADGRDAARLEVPPATKQAAEVLGVSRPFLIRVLEAGEIPFRKIGRHRHVLMQDILAYKNTMQIKRRRTG